MDSVNRLIKQFKPSNYKIDIDLNRIERKFEGKVKITGELQNNSKTITLHAKDLEIIAVSVNDTESSWKLSGDDTLVISPSSSLNDSDDTLVEVRFLGKITDTMNGIYPCYYNHDGQKKELLATQFESHSAREAFPCIDEPEAKATFDVTLTTEKNITVLGNMPIVNQEESDKLTTAFDTTPVMSTYLVAWVAGEIHKKTALTKSGVEVSVWATPAQNTESLDFGLDIATRTIDFFEEYFNTPYPLPKSDHVALPDFSSGAMENWGLVTYRESALLADPKTTSPTDRHSIATVITHELSHQWFGNLVTMKWWNDLWLNESFASIMENVAVDKLEPEWDIWLSETASGVLSALNRDALNGVQAVKSDVSHPDEIQTLFDPSIVYAKGSRLLAMVSKLIGEKALRSGLHDYFKEFAYKNTEATDLWKHLSKASGKDVEGFINTWLNKPGYPVISASVEGDAIKLSQERFFIGEKSNSLIWKIPLNYREFKPAEANDVPEILDRESLVAKAPGAKQGFILNSGATGHFITNYDDELFEKILNNLKELKTIDKLYLLQEQLLLVKSGHKNTASLIPLIKHFSKESDSNIWDIISVIIAEIKIFIDQDSKEEVTFKQIVLNLAKDEYNRLGWSVKPDEKESDTKQRSTIAGLMLYADDIAVTKQALEDYNSIKLEDLNPELRASIFTQLIKSSSDETDEKAKLEELISLYKASQNSAIKDDLMVGITAVKNTENLKYLAYLMQDKDVVKPQDFTYWLVRLMRNRYGKELIWSWVKENWEWIKQTFKNDSHYDMLPRYIASSLNTENQLSEFKKFFEVLKSDLTLKRNIEIGATELRSKVDLIKRDKEAVLLALSQNSEIH